MSRVSRYSRRAFLQGIGAGTALIPLLETDLLAAPLPRRLVLMNFSNGVLAEHFYPSTEGKIGQITLPTVTAPLAQLKDDVTIVGHLALRNFTDYPNHGAGHENFSCLFTGAKGHEIHDGGARFVGGSPTLDQYVAAELAKTTTLAIKCLSQGLVRGNYWHQSRCFYRGPNDPVTPETDPARSFALLFGGGKLPTGPGGAMDLERIRRERRSMLDFLGRDVDGFARRLGIEDRRRVEAHLASIRELEREIAALAIAPVGGGGCAAPRLEPVDASAVTTGKNVPQVLAAQMELIVAAFRCDLTRVATLQLSNGNGAGFIFSFLGLDGPGQEYKFRDYHDIAHRPGSGGADKNKVDRWFVEQLVALARRLKAIPEGTGTMLDSSALLLANHMGNGGAHTSTNLPWIVAGRAGGYLKTGHYIRTGGAATTVVLKTLAGAMGVDSNRFGDPRYGGEYAPLKA